ncbi:MAG: DUF362 domain-containing protein [Proteobacteria bacterium]|nr:DUF362 domain-containing protein [Pseudomonadota bacterium]MBU1739251.1 DUF362 domain-containing protein [Pseudomonadota bacterium]
MKDEGKVFVSAFSGWQGCLDRLLDEIGLPEIIGKKNPVLIKPNLVEALAPPITTPVELIDELIGYLRTKNPALEIIVGEGSGAKEYDTMHAFRELGYVGLAEKRGVRLVDLNSEPLRRLSLEKCRRWPEMYLPELVLDSFLLSVPVLKAHSLASVTITMKNMMGCAPPAHYQKGGHWKKASFHADVQAAVLDLNRYRTPDFTILDATVGMEKAHLWGPTCNPPHRKLAAAVDPVALDAYGAGLLGRDWQGIGHIRGAHGELGKASPLEIITCE